MRSCLFSAYVLVAGMAVGGLSGCGAGDAPGASTPATASTAAPPALASRPATAGEILVRGEGSPATHGPYAFRGRYLVRFTQYAPEDDALDFGGQTPFTAALRRREGDPRGAVELFEAARASGRRELAIRGEYVVDVSFGDFPYALRFTPVERP